MLEVGHTDTHNTTAPHVPSVGLVVAATSNILNLLLLTVSFCYVRPITAQTSGAPDKSPYKTDRELACFAFQRGTASIPFSDFRLGSWSGIGCSG
jgi:hypothetical protein